MFASLKNKIKEETGSDITKLTKTWRTGGLKSQNSIASTNSENGSRSGSAIMTEEEISAELESYLKDRMDGTVDQEHLEQEYRVRLEQRLQEKDTEWEVKFQDMKRSLENAHAEEIALAMAAARAAQLEAQREADIRTRLQEELVELDQYKNARDKLQALGEELDLERREWARQKLECAAELNSAQALEQRARRDLELLKASLPPGHIHHKFDEDVTTTNAEMDEETVKRVLRERAVLSRQLEEAQLALEDIKTSWSGQIATLETQVARVSRACGEEASERRRAEASLNEALQQIKDLQNQLKLKQNALDNANAKVARLNGEVRALSFELKSLKTNDTQQGDIVKRLEETISELRIVNENLTKQLEIQGERVGMLEKQLEAKATECTEQYNELKYLNEFVKDLKEECVEIENNCQKLTLEKDEALLRNAQISQMLEMNKQEMRVQEVAVAELTSNIKIEREVIAKKELIFLEDIRINKERIKELERCETSVKSKIETLENELVNSNKIIKTQNQRIAVMKKTFQRELQQLSKNSGSDEVDISRRYLKHVLLRFLTAHDVEAKQLTRALAALLRLSAQEEALLRKSLPMRSGISSWFGISAS